MKIVTLATGSSGNSYVLEENGQLVLLELGISLPEIKRGIKYRVADVDGAMCTHIHNDHSKSLKKIQNMGIPVFTPYEIENKVQTWKTHGWYLRAFPVPHGDVNCYGTYIMSPGGHKLVYITDFQYCPYVFSKLGINTFLIECNHDDEFGKEENEGHWEHSVRDHSSVSTVCEFLRVNLTDQLRTVILCHASENNLNMEDAVRRVQEVVGDKVQVYVAKRGLEVIFD